nr:unnamed protein product [Callosobruchus analis]
MKKPKFTTCYQDLAESWYNSLTSYKQSWEEWKQMLTNAFPEHRDSPFTLKKMVAREKLPEASWTGYYFGNMKLLKSCKITGENAVAMPIDGIYDTSVQNGANKDHVTKRLLLWTHLKTINFHQRIKFFNCGQLGHISKSCSKPKLGFKKFERIGHTETTWISKGPQPGTLRNVMLLNTKDK